MRHAELHTVCTYLTRVVSEGWQRFKESKQLLTLLKPQQLHHYRKFGITKIDVYVWGLTADVSYSMQLQPVKSFEYQ